MIVQLEKNQMVSKTWYSISSNTISIVNTLIVYKIAIKENKN